MRVAREVMTLAITRASSQSELLRVADALDALRTDARRRLRALKGES